MSGVRGSKGSVETRFFLKVEIAPGGCWIWKGAMSAGGYGVFAESPDHPQTSAHHIIYQWVYGALDETLVVDHLCRVRTCVNPSHLEAVPQRENVRRGLRGVLTTHCPEGHEYTPENTRLERSPRGTFRHCRTCHRDRERARRAALAVSRGGSHGAA